MTSNGELYELWSKLLQGGDIKDYTYGITIGIKGDFRSLETGSGNGELNGEEHEFLRWKLGVCSGLLAFACG